MILSATAYSVGYSNKAVLRDISFSVENKGIIVVLGKNGAGKTTLFRAISGLLRPISGQITFNDMGIQRSRVEIGYLAHSDGIPAGFTVRSAMDFFARIDRADAEIVEHLIKRMQLSEIMNIKFASLSQGQKKRVSLAKCLLKPRDIYIFDEPTGHFYPNLVLHWF